MKDKEKNSLISRENIVDDAFERAAKETRLFGNFVKSDFESVNGELKTSDDKVVFSHKLAFREFERTPDGKVVLDEESKPKTHLTTVQLITDKKVDFEKTHIFDKDRTCQLVGVKQTVEFTDKDTKEKRTTEIINPISFRIYPAKKIVRVEEKVEKVEKTEKTEQKQSKGKSR